MKKKQIQNVILHTENININTLTGKVNRFHTDWIERRLGQSNLSQEQKIIVIDKIIETLKSHEKNYLNNF